MSRADLKDALSRLSVTPSKTGMQLALAQAAKGWRVFPAREKAADVKGELKGVKAPYTEHGHLDATTDPETIATWWQLDYPDALVAVSTHRSGFSVLDFDDHEGSVNGFDTLAAMGRTVSASFFGASFSMKGMHYWLVGETKSGTIAPGIDRKGTGGYIITPYELPWPSEISEVMPAWAMPGSQEMVDKGDSRRWTGDLATWSSSLRLDLPDESAERLIAKLIEGEFDYGNMRDAIWVAVKVGSQGYSGMDRAIETVRESYCRGQWDTPTNRARVDSAIRTAIEHHGPWTGPRRHFDDAWLERVLTEQPEWPELELPYDLRDDDVNELAFDPITGVEYEPEVWSMAQDILKRRQAQRIADDLEASDSFSVQPFGVVDTWRESQPVWDGFLYEDTVAVIGADGGVGKTTFALGLALAMGNNQQILGRDVQQGRVLYVGGEGVRAFSKRKAAWKQHFGLSAVSDSHIDLSTDQMGARSIKRLIDLHGSNPYKLIVFDTLSALFSVADENASGKAKGMGLVMQQLKAVRDAAPGSCVLLLHHTTNTVDSRGRKQSKLRGSTAIRNDADTAILMTGTRDSIQVSTEPEFGGKQRDAEPMTLRDICLRKSGPSVIIDQQGDRERARVESELLQLLKCFRDADHEMGARTLQQVSGMGNSKFEMHKTEAIRAGLLIKNGISNKAPYKLTEKGYRVASQGYISID